MESIGRTEVGSAVLLSLLLVAGCSDEPLGPGEQTTRSGRVSAGGPAGKFLTLTLDGNVTIKLVRIEAGTFTMGSPETEQDRMDNEGLQRRVTISKPFYIGVTEVTQAQYNAVTGKDPSRFKEQPDHPVEEVSWLDCVEFCKVLSKTAGRVVRLPTEAEWEYVCRAGTTTCFNFGDDAGDLDAHAWYKSNSGAKTHPVGQKEPNAWGVYDMHGSVWEWCSDRYADVYVGAGTRDPQGPAAGKRRVLRSGSWRRPPAYCRSACRHKSDPSNHYDSTGFRVVVEIR